MKKVVVGSNNPVKLEAAEAAFRLMFAGEQFEFVACSAKSGVPDQPFGTEETKRGATNRAKDALRIYPDADYFVGQEGGLEKVDGQYQAFAWMCIINKNGKYGYGRTGSFLLPNKISQLINEGVELGIATDIAFAEENSKHKEGTIGLLTKDVVTRKDFYQQALVFALVPLVNEDLY